MKTFKWLVTVSLLFTIAAGCSNDPLAISTEGVSVPLKQTRLDSLLTKTDSARLLHVIMEQRLRTPDLVDYQLAYCFGVGQVTDSTIVPNLVKFQQEPYLKRLQQRINEQFPQLTQRTRTIEDGLAHLKAHFPKGRFPSTIVYMNSYFSSSVYCTEQEIAIGLERYLGEKTDVIAELPTQTFYPWIKAKFDARYLERDAIGGWVMRHFVEPKENAMNIEAIITWGKIIYLIEAAYPEKPKHWIMRYTERELNWAIENERNFWDYLVAEKMLFETNERVQANLLNDGPFTTGLPEKGPDRLGQFLGWRIVQSYMEQYDLTLQELMRLPYTTLLQEYEIAD